MPTDTVNQIMNTDVATCAPDATLHEAAAKMQEQQIGDVVITEDGQLRGLLTDRDIIVRAIADGRDPEQTSVSEICSDEIEFLSPDDSTDAAVALMRSRSVRRIPVVEDQQVVGILSLGDLAADRDRESVLGQISTAPANL